MVQVNRIIPLRSDGRLTTTTGNRKKEEENGPTPEQFERSKGENGVWSWYQEIPLDDPKHVDWRRKLAGMLLEEIRTRMKAPSALPETGPLSESGMAPKDSYILACFPENYRLFEHRRMANPDNPDLKDKNDRRDAYLYGHPGGRKKRFRSPLDFIYHLLWLETDPELDPENCPCKLCTPEEFLKAAEEMSALQEKLYGIVDGRSEEDVKSQVLAQGKPPAIDATGQKNVAIVSGTSTPKHSSQLQGQPTKLAVKSSPKSATNPSRSTAPVASVVPKAGIIMTPIPLTPPKNHEQAIDQQLNKYIYRNGELVWYRRDSGAVGLAAVISRDLQRDSNNLELATYVVQPLSHPFEHPELQLITQESRIVPWLAYSTPSCHHKPLRTFNGTYDEINWEGVINGAYGTGDSEVDGSIFAAKTVDMTYTLIQTLSTSAPKTSELEYNGLYLGGEQIWVGEAIRLHTGAGKNIMIVSHIIETVQQPPSAPQVDVVGDVYALSAAPHNPSRPRPQNHYLPIRVQEDLKYRNGPRIAQMGEVLYWKFIEGQSRISISQVKGRWYESRLVLPIIMTQNIQSNIEKGEIPDVGDCLNSRGSGLLEAQIGTKKTERLQAFSRAIPAGTQLGVSFRAPQQGSGYVSPPDESVGEFDRNGGLAHTDTDMSEFVDVNQLADCGYNQGF